MSALGHTQLGITTATLSPPNDWLPALRAKQRVKRQMLERDGYRCVKCGSRERLTLDHRIPRALGGKTTLDNVQTLCYACNHAKGDRLETSTHKSTLALPHDASDITTAALMSNEPTAILAELLRLLERAFDAGWKRARECPSSHSPAAIQEDVCQLKELITMKSAELAADLNTVNAQIAKVATEQSARFDDLVAKIKALEEQVANGDVPQEVSAALDAVKTSLQALDDTIPDAPPAPPA